MSVEVNVKNIQKGPDRGGANKRLEITLSAPESIRCICPHLCQAPADTRPVP